MSVSYVGEDNLLFVCLFHRVCLQGVMVDNKKMKFIQSSSILQFQRHLYVQNLSLNKCWFGGCSLLQTSEYVWYFSFLQIHVGVFVTFVTFSGFTFLFMMLKFPLKKQTAICHTSIFNRKIFRRVLPDIRGLLPFFHPLKQTPASVFFILALLFLIWPFLDALMGFLCLFYQV